MSLYLVRLADDEIVCMHMHTHTSQIQPEVIFRATDVLIAINTHIRIVKRETQLYSFLWTLSAFPSSTSPFLHISLLT